MAGLKANATCTFLLVLPKAGGKGSRSAWNGPFSKIVIPSGILLEIQRLVIDERKCIHRTLKLMTTQLRLLCAPLVFALSLSAWGIDVTLYVQQHSYCGRASGVIYASPSGGVPPYTYLWSNGSTETSLVAVGAGLYSVTITDSQLDQATAEGEVLLLNSYDYQAGGPTPIMHCPGELEIAVAYTGMDVVGVQPAPESIYGPNPYSFDAPGLTHLGQSTNCVNPGGIVWELFTYDGPEQGAINVAYTDANGCPGTTQLLLGGPMTWPMIQLIDVMPSCANYNTGSITFSAQWADWLGNDLIRWRAHADPSSCGNFAATNSDGTKTISDLEPGDYWIISSNDVLDLFEEGGPGSAFSYLECKDSIMVTVPALSEDCGMITGRLYIDENANCVMNGGENRIPESIIEITPGPSYVTTSNTGQYTAYLPFGTYTLAEQNAVYVQSCPAEVTISTGNSQTVNVGCEGGVPMDAQVSMANGPARPGFELHYAVDIDNLTSGSPGTVTLSLTFDTNLGFLSASPSPTSVSGNTLTWTAPSLNLNTPFAHRDVNVHFQVPSDVGLIGTTLNTSVTLVTENTDADLTNNTVSSAQLVTGSYDPNDKVATTSSNASTTQYFIDGDEWVDYVIRFQNTGTDTAFNVIITDTLPSTLDPGSIQWGATSHTCTRTLAGQGVLKFIFANIMLPDSGANEAASHGFVSFRIKPVLPLLHGTIIENIANIYFDFNPPIITEPCVLVAEFSTGIAERSERTLDVFPNPTSDKVTVRLAQGVIKAITILAMDGRVERVIGGRSNTEVVDMGGLSSGMHLFRIESTDGAIEHRVIVKTGE